MRVDESFTCLLSNDLGLSWTLILAWPRAWELKKTLIQIWSLNSHTTLVDCYPHSIACRRVEQNSQSKSGHSTLRQLSWTTRVEQNSHPNLVTQPSHTTLMLVRPGLKWSKTNRYKKWVKKVSKIPSAPPGHGASAVLPPKVLCQIMLIFTSLAQKSCLETVGDSAEIANNQINNLFKVN